tara:strand:+ start:725 stop:985 length:261 start_codon:yes stop_codon:yes gene_type:complete
MEKRLIKGEYFKFYKETNCYEKAQAIAKKLRKKGLFFRIQGDYYRGRNLWTIFYRNPKHLNHINQYDNLLVGDYVVEEEHKEERVW